MALAASCPPTGSFRLHDFQGHALNVGANENPIISYPPQTPSTLNEQWSFVSGMQMVTALNGQVVTWAKSTPNVGQPALSQATTTTGTGLSFSVTCINSTSAYIRETIFESTLTAWKASPTFLQSPVTFEDFASATEQIWTLESLD
ncbi:hypothetical protein C8R45DRAFT_1081597 [Mycena sanguinolenta]|nr:hypothetical protein C8R45DRAFT_1081597 [Mycena sanguinolenta]